MSKIVNELIEQKLYELMENFSFEDLSAVEKEFIENHFSKEEFIAQRGMMKELEALESAAYVHKIPTSKVDAPTPNKESNSIFKLKIPVYTAAASIILAIALTTFLSTNNNQKGFVNLDESTIQKQPKDSIYNDIEEQLVKEESAPTLLADSLETERVKESIEFTMKKPKGTSAAEDPYTIFYSAL